ncbi:glycerol-3-phosphate 1-O-acyltransferase PlsY [Glaciimonas sp. GG7]
MIDILKITLALILGYASGGLNSAVIVGKLYGKDIRNFGSKSAGLTNTLRVLGKYAALLVLAGDILKGIVACLIGLRIGVYVQAGGNTDCLSLLAAGAGAVFGHNWPPYFGFRGGKGALIAISVLFMFVPIMAVICLSLFLIIVIVTRYVSLGTVSAMLLFAVLSFVPFFSHTYYFVMFAIIMASVITLKHKANIERLIAGTESKINLKA